MNLRIAATALIALVLLAACGGAAHVASTPGPQTRQYDGHKGFALELAPGWRATGSDVDRVAFASSRVQATMSVQYLSAGTGGLDGAVNRVMSQLTGGVMPSSTAPATLAGAPARTFETMVTGKGGAQTVSGVVAVQGDLAWALALAGMRSTFGQAKSDFEQMVGSFEFKGPAPTPVPTASLGQAAPDSPVLQLSHVQGPVVLYFFNVACQPCRQEMPLLQSRATESSPHVTVLAVDTSDDAQSVRSFLKTLNVSLQVRYDDNAKLYGTYQVPGIPASYFLDARHVIRFIPNRPLDPSTLDQGLRLIGT
jgi:peroxiredoxin